MSKLQRLFLIVVAIGRDRSIGENALVTANIGKIRESLRSQKDATPRDL